MTTRCCRFNLICTILSISLTTFIIACYSYLYYDPEQISSSILINDNGNNQQYYYKHKLPQKYQSSANDHTFLSLMSFNLRNEELDKDDIEQYKHWDIRKDAVYHLLNDINSDLIGTQEGIVSQIEDIAFHLNAKYSKYGLGRLPSHWYLSSTDRMNEHCTIYWKQSKFQIFDEGTFWLSDQPDVAGTVFPGDHLPRIATWILLDIRQNTKYRILFISTHLGLYSEMRMGQITLITKFVHEMMTEQQSEHNKELLVFIVGDFNEGVHNELWNNLFEERKANNTEKEDGVSVSDILTDCVMEWEHQRNKSLNSNITFHKFFGLDAKREDLLYYVPIDWILCSKNVVQNDDILMLDAFVVTKTRVDYKYDEPQSAKKIYPSDHFPLVLEIALLNQTSVQRPSAKLDK